MFAPSFCDDADEHEEEHEQEQEEGGNTSSFLRKCREGFGGAEGEDEMQEWEPAETPTKNAGSGQHGEDENNE